MSTVCAEMEIGSAITKMIAKNRDVILILKFFFITLPQMRFCDIRCTIHVVRWIVHWNHSYLRKDKIKF